MFNLRGGDLHSGDLHSGATYRDLRELSRQREEGREGGMGRREGGEGGRREGGREGSRVVFNARYRVGPGSPQLDYS